MGALLPEKVALQQDMKWPERKGAGGSWEEAPEVDQCLQPPRGASVWLTRAGRAVHAAGVQ